MFIGSRIFRMPMKRAIALLFCLLMMTVSLAGCVESNDDSIEVPEHVVDNLLCIGEIGPSFVGSITSRDHPSVITPIVFNEELYYFAGNDEFSGVDLWKYNGIDASIVAEIEGWDETGFVIFNDELYFGAYDEIHGHELWKYDGTTASMVADLVPGSNGSEPTELKVYDGELYFNAYDEIHGLELWKYDGTTASMVADINPSGYGNPTGLTVFKNELYFTASDGIHGNELWKYNGTNVSMVIDMNPHREKEMYDNEVFWGSESYTNGSYTSIIAVFNNELYFSGFTAFDGSNLADPEIWKTDGINVSMVASKYSIYGTVFKGDLILVTENGLESYDGTNFSSIATSDLWFEPDSVSAGLFAPSVPIVFNGNLFFGIINEIEAQELWLYDGTNSSHVATYYRPFSYTNGPQDEWGLLSSTSSMNRLTLYNDELFVVVSSEVNELCKYSPSSL